MARLQFHLDCVCWLLWPNFVLALQAGGSEVDATAVNNAEDILAIGGEQLLYLTALRLNLREIFSDTHAVGGCHSLLSYVATRTI